MKKSKAPAGWQELEDFEEAKQKVASKLAKHIEDLAEVFEGDSSLANSSLVQKAISRFNKATGNSRSSKEKAGTKTETFDWDELVELLYQRNIKSKKNGVTKSEMEELYFKNSHTKFEHNKWNNKEQKESVLAYDPNASNKLRRYWLKRR